MASRRQVWISAYTRVRAQRLLQLCEFRLGLGKEHLRLSAQVKGVECARVAKFVWRGCLQKLKGFGGIVAVQFNSGANRRYPILSVEGGFRHVFRQILRYRLRAR